MSAPAFVIPAAPFMGSVAAPKRGGATVDADFAAVLDEAAPAEAPAKPTAPAIARKETEAAPSPVEDAAASEPAADAVLVPVDAIVAAVPAIPVTPAPTIVAEVEVVVTEALPAAPVAEAPPPPTAGPVPANDQSPNPASAPGLMAAPTPLPPASTTGPAPIAAPAAEAPAPAPAPAPNPDTAVQKGVALPPSVSSFEKDAPAAAPVANPAPTKAPVETSGKAAAPVVAETSADPAEPASVLPEAPKPGPTPSAAAAVAAILTAPVTPPTPRPAKSTVETIAPAETGSPEEAAVAAEAAPLEIPTAPAEAPRTRDVIDRALSRRTDAQVPSGGAAIADASPSSDGGEPAAPVPAAQPAAARPASFVAPTAPPVQIAEDTVVTAPPAATTAQPAQAHVADPALSLALSTASHASIETTAQIAAQIVRKLEGRSTRFEMALTPEGLGNIDVSLDIDADGKLIAKMAFDNPLAATELRGRVDELRRQLQESGFTVADDALTFTERDASAGQQGGSAFDRRPDPRSARAFGAGARLSAEADIAVPGRWIPLTLTPDRVDMKV